MWCELSGVEKIIEKNFQKLLTFYEPRGNILLVADEATKNPNNCVEGAMPKCQVSPPKMTPQRKVGNKNGNEVS